MDTGETQDSNNNRNRHINWDLTTSTAYPIKFCWIDWKEYN